MPGNDRVLGFCIVRGPLPPYHRCRPPPHHYNDFIKIFTEVKLVFVSETSLHQSILNLIPPTSHKRADVILERSLIGNR